MVADCLWGRASSQERKSEDLASILRSIPVFADLKEREIRELSQIVHRRVYEKGEVIFREGEPGAGMYIILDGSVRVYTCASNSREIELAQLGKGEFFGEVALLDDGPRSAWAVALEGSHLVGLMKPDLFDFMDRNPAAGVKIVLKLSQVLAERLRRTNEEVRRMRIQDYLQQRE